jgi:adenine/guanine phosphoribosyltransferase-like PRPP-binding protein
MPIEYIQDYLVVNKTKRKRIMNRCKKEMINFPEFDAFAFRGNSGALMGMPLAFSLNKEIIVVRKTKDEEDHHSWQMVEGLSPNGARIVIVDDFISSGRTIEVITTAINAIASKDNPCKFVGLLLYNQEHEPPSSENNPWNKIETVSFFIK